jgi:hypothetical protein
MSSHSQKIVLWLCLWWINYYLSLRLLNIGTRPRMLTVILLSRWIFVKSCRSRFRPPEEFVATPPREGWTPSRSFCRVVRWQWLTKFLCLICSVLRSLHYYIILRITFWVCWFNKNLIDITYKILSFVKLTVLFI